MFKHGFPPEWSTFKKLIWLVGSGIAGAASGIWKTVTGSLIHITDAIAAPMQKCEVTLEPIQDLHGQDAPYPAGGGKNKIDQTTLEQGGINNTDGQDYDALPERQVRNNGYCPVKGDTSYTLSADISFSLVTTYVYFYDASKNYLSGIDRSAATLQFTFSTPSNCAFLRFKVYSSSAGCSPSDIANLQLEEGSLKTAFAPYSNICPITGWTGTAVNVTGKNLCNPDDIGDINSTASNVRKGIYFSKAGTYTVSAKAKQDRQISARVKSSDGTYGTSTIISSLNDLRSVTYTLYDGDTIIIFDATQTDKDTAKLAFETAQIQLEVGSSETDFEEYQGTTFSVTFPDSAGTVYGGTVDLVSGVLTVDRAIKDLGSFTWNYATDNLNPVFYVQPMDISPRPKTTAYEVTCVSSIYKGYKNTSFANFANYANDYQVCISASGTIGRILVRNSQYTTTQAFKTAMSGVQLVYELAEPTEIQLTPQPISTLKSVNNVWSNTNGDTTIIYKAQAS